MYFYEENKKGIKVRKTKSYSSYLLNEPNILMSEQPKQK